MNFHELVILLLASRAPSVTDFGPEAGTLMQMRESFAIGMFANILQSPEGLARKPPIRREPPNGSAAAPLIGGQMQLTTGVPHTTSSQLFLYKEKARRNYLYWSTFRIQYVYS